MEITRKMGFRPANEDVLQAETYFSRVRTPDELQASGSAPRHELQPDSIQTTILD